MLVAEEERTASVSLAHSGSTSCAPVGAARGSASAEAAGAAREVRRCGPAVEQPPPRSSPPGSYSEMSLRAADGPSPSPPRPTLATSPPRLPLSAGPAPP